MTRQNSRIVLLTASAVLLFGSTASSPAGADPLIFNSVATLNYTGETGGVHYYDYHLTSAEQPFFEVYLVLDQAKVVYGAEGSIGLDAQFVSADFLSHPSVDLFFSTDRRSFANINNPRLLNFNEMDTYDPTLTDGLPDNTFSLDIRIGLNRSLSTGEMDKLGYWAGDLRGMIDDTMPFTESDGNPVPEPATLLLTVAGLAGLYGARRRRAS